MTKEPTEDDPDRTAIIAVIEEETAAWIRRDLSGWAACWVQDERAQHVNARPSVGARRLRGFVAIHAFFASVMEQLPENSVPPEAIRKEDWRISIGADMAWVTFDQVIPLDAPSNAAPGRHHQMRILEKVAGEWKIAAVFHIPNRIGYYEVPWVRVDHHARIIESGARAQEALRSHKALRIVGQRLVGQRATDNRKLKDALAGAADLIRRRVGRSPMPLVLHDAEGLSISLCWISIADMMIVILLDDEQLLARSIARGGAAYGLSAAQIRVAEAIARGNDLNRVAELLGVQPNTVRTHVKRMFERVGANGQPALMRALLSAEAPKP